MKSLRLIIPLIVFLALCGLFYATLDRDTQLLPSPLVGKPVPDFSLPALPTIDIATGEILPLTESTLSVNSFQGQKWILNIWASWCAACRVEHPIFNEIHQQTDWTIVGLNYKDAQQDAQQWLLELQNPYEALFMIMKAL